MTTQQSAPLAGMMMGSSSGRKVIRHAVDMLTQFGIPFKTQIVSTHCMPNDMFGYAEAARGWGPRAIITGAGGATHLPGMIAAKTIVPVFGVPVPSKYLRGEDSLLSIVQIPKGIPVSTFAIDEAGTANAMLAAIATIATANSTLADGLEAFRAQQTEVACDMTFPVYGA